MTTQDYLLFLDTETTGLPARWDRPYADKQHWPCVAQLAWEVYTAEGKRIKADQDYLQIPAGRMPAAAVAIHGLTPEFLARHGQHPPVVLGRLLQDLQTYRPRVVGHFLRLDFHVLGAALEQAGLANPLPGLPQFCTMNLPLSSLPGAPRRFLRLNELHELLFGEPLARLHAAHIDAAATARCFFELRHRGLISPAVLTGQPPLTVPAARLRSGPWRWVAGLAGAAGLLALLYHLVYG